MAYESVFSHITSKLEHRVEVLTPTAYGGSVIEDLAAVPMTGIQSDRLIKRTYISRERICCCCYKNRGEYTPILLQSMDR